MMVNVMIQNTKDIKDVKEFNKPFFHGILNSIRDKFSLTAPSRISILRYQLDQSVCSFYYHSYCYLRFLLNKNQVSSFRLFLNRDLGLLRVIILYGKKSKNRYDNVFNIVNIEDTFKKSNEKFNKDVKVTSPRKRLTNVG